ncbi:MAG: undecaprenyldiphospho-muramoylpentapeptide beta-N-acetylglucosaminyltransferase [Chromatiales bacterium]|nr:undecaprenyldiphospho-muramoylpentapeptide beta-N-acetylglucosaminyltransferase [Chromatiales bacterium]
MSSAPVLIMAGGTGGHVFPALAVARALRLRNERVVWLGTDRGLESRVVPAEGFPLEKIRVQGLRGKGVLTWLLAPLRVLVAVADALRVVRRCRPKVVLGMGGYTAGPGGLAAWLLRRPLVIHEQNAVAGLTNRLLAGFAREVLQAFPGAFSASVKCRVTGNPVRADIAALPPPATRLAGRSGPWRLLVLGGSQGARALNEAVAGAVALLPREQRPEIRHQAGEATRPVAEAAYRAAGVEARVHPFISDMAEAYGWADLVLARSGALTVAELAAAGVGAVLVPFPAAVDDHQTRNAAFLVDAGAATLLPQSELTAGRLAAEFQAYVDRPELRLQRAERARALAMPRATDEIVSICLAAARSPGHA